MPEKKWTAVDRYYSDLLVENDPALTGALDASKAAGLPPINVAPNQGKFLHLIARMLRAKSILEIGTLGGYSTIWLARGLSRRGKLITLEADKKHASVARKNITNALLSKKVELFLGKAIKTLPKLAAMGRGPFDLIFIDADKPSTPDYFSWALQLSRVGTVIIVDNVVRQGAIIDARSPDRSVQGVRLFNKMLAVEPRVSATAIQTVGSKGYDGFAIGLVVR